jgi:hypothetical protein
MDMFLFCSTGARDMPETGTDDVRPDLDLVYDGPVPDFARAVVRAGSRAAAELRRAESQLRFLKSQVSFHMRAAREWRRLGISARVELNLVDARANLRHWRAWRRRAADLRAMIAAPEPGFLPPSPNALHEAKAELAHLLALYGVARIAAAARRGLAAELV